MPRRRDLLERKTRSIRRLFILNSVIWFGLATYLILEMLSFRNNLPAVLVGFVMYLNAAGMLLSGILLHKRIRWAYPFALLFLSANILLTFTDQFGAMDLLTLLLDLAILVMLVSIGRVYLSRP